MVFQNYIKLSLLDIRGSVDKAYLAFMLGWQDIKQRYRRSKLGPFWLTISMGVMIGTIGIVFSQVFKSPMVDYLPFLATGIIIWAFFSSSIMEGSSAFIESAGMIRQLNLPLSLYPVRTLWRNIVILGHNIIILPFVFLAVGKGINVNIFWIIPGFIIFLMNLIWISLFLGTLCTRYRDMPQIVNSILQVLFYITPVIWIPNSLNPRSASLLTTPNPVYHLIELVRAPLLGQVPTFLNFSVGIGMAIIGICLSLVFFGKYKKRIAYWL